MTRNMKEKTYRYKYLHILPQGSIVFDTSLINAINETEIFEQNEHCFVTYSTTVYKSVKSFSNVKYYSKTIHQDFACFKELFKSAKYVVMHSNVLTLGELIKLGNVNLKKIIWCVWGHDLYINDAMMKKDTHVSMIKRLKSFVRNVIWKVRDNYLKKLKGVCIGFEHDAKEVRRRFGNRIEIHNATYFFNKQNIEYYDEIKRKNVKADNSCNIMIGHSAFRFLDHKNILDKFAKFKNEDIKIYLVMSYGDKDYAKEVYEHAIKIYGDKIVLIDEFMDKYEYTRFLSKIDIAVFNQLHQTALANIFMLLYFDVTLYLNPKGLIADALKEEGCYIEYTDTINHKTFDTLIENTRDFGRNNEAVLQYLDYNTKAKQWKKMFDTLK